MPDVGAPDSLAVLIDADNTSARHAQAIFEEIVKLGEANVRRIYGDFSRNRLAGWDDAVKSLAILQHQQRNNTTGKNAADIALVIDAMDLMHKGRLDGFCLISSDSDFTRLAQRLREDGLAVYGFGERKTPEAFRNACNRFIYVENLIEDVAEKDSASNAAAAETEKEPPSKAVDIVVKAMEGEDDDGWVHLGSVGSRILGAAPDFDPRTYGCPNLSTLVTKSGGFEVRKDAGGAGSIRRKPAAKKARGKTRERNGRDRLRGAGREPPQSRPRRRHAERPGSGKQGQPPFASSAASI
ncbi:MAG: NYN domain-containing protein, partial [Defluviicoccus sp.]|nr:NYN domain-containing protein [Defluviicoccus sp.]